MFPWVSFLGLPKCLWSGSVYKRTYILYSEQNILNCVHRDVWADLNKFHYGSHKASHLREHLQLFFMFFNIYLFIWLCRVLAAAHGIFHLHFSPWYLSLWLSGSYLWHVESSSPTRDQTQSPYLGNAVLATGPPGKWSEVKVAQSCLTLCDPMDYTVHGILQARILKWVAIPFSRGSSQPRDQTQVSCTAGRFFTRWVTREAQMTREVPSNS